MSKFKSKRALSPSGNDNLSAKRAEQISNRDASVENALSSSSSSSSSSALPSTQTESKRTFPHAKMNNPVPNEMPPSPAEPPAPARKTAKESKLEGLIAEKTVSYAHATIWALIVVCTCSCSVHARSRDVFNSLRTNYRLASETFRSV